MAETPDNREYEARLKKALQAMQQMRIRLDGFEKAQKEPVAIVGVACRFPGGADSPAAYWDLLRNGVDATSEVPASRWNADAFYDPDPLAPGKTYTRRGGFLREIDSFDAEFFGIAPREATAMDPQQRLLLELSWEALEAAGQPAERLVGSRTGVFIGISTSDYAQYHLNSGDVGRIDAYSGTGVALSIAAGRVSYVYGLQGPNVAVDTFCSSSLVAIHLACQSLRRRESDMALAGGVNLILSPAGTIYSCKVHALATDGRCKTFDASADGYGRGEGCGILVLKRLSDAIDSNDKVLALIRGTAMNHDGRSSGLTVPNGMSQQAVIRAAHEDAGIDSAEVSYVEAHGTGTPLGDPIELRALAAVVASKRSKHDPLFVGSAKTNIGHLEAAAGVAGVIKVALALDKREIPANLHLQVPNPHVPWDDLPIEIPTAARAWNPAGRTLIAGVSSFGFSGTNAHAILQEAPAPRRRVPLNLRSEYILPLSARTPAALAAMVQNHRDLLAKNPDLSLHDLCYTAGVRRSHDEQRAAFIGGTAQELAASLASFVPKPAAAASEDFALVFGERIAFEDAPGEPVFQEMRSRCESAGAPLYFTTLMAHAALWKSWGMAPRAIVAKGPAASVAGWFSGSLTFDESLHGAVPPGIAATADGLLVLEVGARKPLDQLADLYTAGIRVDWARLYPTGNLIPLPAYPWQRRRFWMDDAAVARTPSGAEPGQGHPLLGRRILSPALTQVVFEAGIGASSPSFLKDHRIQDQVVFPASAYVEICVAAAEGSRISELTIREPLVLPEDQIIALQTVVSGAALQIYSLAGGNTWKLHAAATFSANERSMAPPLLAEIETRLRSEISTGEIYERTRALGLDYGAAFRGLQRLRWNDTEALGEIEVAADSREYTLHPALLDSCLQVLGARLLALSGTEPFLPSKIGSVQVLTKPAMRVFCYVSFSGHAAPGTWEADMQVINPDGRLAVDVRGVVCRQILKAPASERLRYAVEWREKESFFADEQGEPGVWIVLADAAGLAENVAKRLGRKHQQCVMVTTGDSYSFDGQNATVNPSRSEHFRQLIQEAPAGAGLALAGFIHMWALDTQCEHAVESAFRAAQAIGRAKLQEPPKFCIVTRGGQALASNAPVSPLHAALAGFGRTVAVEHPDQHPIVIDLPPEPDGTDEAQFLFEEFLSRNPEDLAGIRKAVRYVPRLRHENAAAPGPAVQIRSAASYLITGGLGALGLEVAHWLSRKGARHLALVSRGEPSDSVRESLGTLERQGVGIKLLKADVSNAAELQAALAAVDAGAPLAGVIHAAGVLDDGLLVQQTWERFDRVLAPKAAGAWNLHELTKDRALDFFVLFSSAAALLGSPGQSSYATANAFLDGLAAHRRALGLPGVSIEWGAWSGAGMAARVGEREQRAWAERGIDAIAPDLGLAELGALLDASAPQIAVLKVDWARFVRQYPAGGESPLLSELARDARKHAAQTDGAPDARMKLLRRLEEGSPVERLEILADFVRAQVAEVLGFSSLTGLDPNQGFFEIGMDSLMAVDLQRRLQMGLGITLSSTVGFDHPTVEALARHLAEKGLNFRNTSPKAVPATAARVKKAAGEDALRDIPEEELVALLSKELGG